MEHQHYFLSEVRRVQLIRDLTNLSMPRNLAEEFANFADGDVAYIDRNLAFHIHGMSFRCRSLAKAAQRGDDKRARNLQTYIQCDCIIVRSYLAEIGERQLPRERFPKTSAAMRAGLAVTDKAKEMILSAMGKAGMLQ
jgi:hypothetical protein